MPLRFKGRKGAGSCNLGQFVASSRDSRAYKNLSTVEMGLPVVSMCQRFDQHCPTLNTPQPDRLCSGLVQQPAHCFWLVFVSTIFTLIPNAILTHVSVQENQRNVPCPAFIGPCAKISKM